MHSCNPTKKDEHKQIRTDIGKQAKQKQNGHEPGNMRDVQHSDSEHKYSAQTWLEAFATSTLLDVPHNAYVVQFGAKKKTRNEGIVTTI